MGSTASINYAASKKYKPSDTIEVKFNKVVKYDDGDEKPFRDEFQLATKKQPLSLLATAIRILEKKPKQYPQQNAHHPPSNYAKQVRPRSAYVVLKKPAHLSSLNSSYQSGSLANGTTHKLSQQKQLKTKQNLYISLIDPTRAGMTVPSRIRTPMDYHLPIRPPKANTLPRNTAADGKRLRVNRKLYMDMIRPVMASPQYLKLGASRSGPPIPLSNRTTSRQSQLQQTRFTPRPPNGKILGQRDPNSRASRQHKGAPQSEHYRPRREEYTSVNRPPSSYVISDHSVSLNSSLTHRDRLPRITRKTRDEVSLNSSLNSRSQIPQGHPENIKPLYFRKSLAYSPHYEHNELLSRPLSSMNN